MELVQLLELLRDGLVDVDRPLLVLRDETRVLHAVDRDAHLLLGDARVGLQVQDVVPRDERLVRAALREYAAIVQLELTDGSLDRGALREAFSGT